MKPTRLKIQFLTLAIFALFFNTIVFFSAFSSPVFLNAGLGAAVALLFYFLKFGKDFLSVQQRRFVVLLLGILILTSLIYDFSYFYKKSLARNWEDDIKSSLQKEAAHIQDSFQNLQSGIDYKAAKLQRDIADSISGFKENSPELKAKAVSVLNSRATYYLQDEFFFGAGLYGTDSSLIAWWGTASSEALPHISPSEGNDSVFYNSVDEVRSYINNIRLLRNKDGRTKYYLVVRRLLRTDFRIRNRFLTDYNYFERQTAYKINAKLFDSENKEAQFQWENLFYRNRDFYWGHSEEETKTLTVPIRNLSLEIIGYISLTSTTIGEDIHNVSMKFSFICSSLILAIPALMIICFLRRRCAGTKSRYSGTNGFFLGSHSDALKTILMLWVFRLAVSLLGYPSRFLDIDLLRPTYLAIDLFNFKNAFLDDLLNLYVSPFDMFLTMGIILLSLLIVFSEIKRYTLSFAGGSDDSGVSRKNLPKAPIRMAILITSLVIGSAVLLLILKLNYSFMVAIFENIRLDVLWSSFVDLNIAKFIIQISLVGGTVAFVLVILIVNTIQLIFLSSFVSKSVSLAAVSILDLMIGVGVGFIGGFFPFPLISRLAVFAAPIFFLFFNIRHLQKKPRQSFLFIFAKPFVVIFLSVLSQTALYFHIFQQQQELFIEKNLVNRLSEQKEWNIIIMRNALEQYSRDRALMTKLKNKDVVHIEALAYSLWSRLDPALKGYNTSLEIHDGAGRLIDRFSINPLYNNQDLSPQQSEPRILLNSKWIYHDNRNIEVLVGQAVCKDGEEILAKILLCYSFDYNYIFLPSTRNPYYELFRASDEAIGTESLLSRNLFFMIYDREGNYKTGSEEFSLPMERDNILQLQKLEKSEWLVVGTGDREYKLLAFLQGDDIFLLGYPVPNLLDLIFYLSEVFGICFFTTVLVLLIFGLFKIDLRKAKIRDFFSMRSYLGKSYVRLLITLIIFSIIPIVFLAVFAYEHLSGMMSQEVETRGINSLKVVKRYIDLNTLYGRVRDENTIADLITDPLISDIGKWINRDLNIHYARGLIATNKQELYFSRLLPPVLNSRLYEKLMYKKELYASTEERIGDLSYLIVGALVPTDNPQKPLVITIPLMTEQNRIKQELSDFLRLIIFIVIVLINLFILLSHWLAARFSSPIQKLIEGAEQIAAGDYKMKLEIDRKDEIGSLIKSFNEMARNLAKQREELFRKTRDLESILSYASTGVVSFTPFGRIITVNPAALKMLRLKGKPEEYIGEELASLFGKKPAFKDLLAAYDEYKRNMKTTLTSDLRMAFKENSDEKEVVANVVITPMWDEGHNLYASLMIIEDVTEIIRSKRLEAWAEMARIIAHEIKNPLTPIQLAAQHLQVVIKDRAENLDEISNECLTTILQKVSELKQFSDDFWRYSELPKLSAEPFNIGKFIEDAVSPYAIAPPEGIKLRVEIPPKTPLVMMDKKLMKQTFINLIENSYHAMRDGGMLTIRIDYGRELRKKGIIEISVNDTGVGIRTEDLPHVFEPYFSTKEKGVGLGLAIARKTIEEHQGTIAIESRPGEGTTVRVSLRVHEGKREPDL